MQDRLAYAHSRVADVLLKMGRTAGGVRALSEDVDAPRGSGAVRADPDSKAKRDYLAQGYTSFGFALAARAKSRGAAEDYAEALRWYRRGSDAGDALAMANIGFCYRDGEGVAKDYAQALSWFRKAADRGSQYGMYGIGTIYSGGFGVVQDHTEAAQWYRKAADAGEESAMVALALAHEKGHGVPSDRDQAIRWFQKAAAAGSPEAKKELIRLGASQ